ncbi:mandelate racemase/muconate lactonizing enzyme family protein [Phytoactinopolyspora limicola]|uniref:mandelate racemase/muconate lactonizing enzyme family protein n=1 Tax=Phytoactinopolyspora limicola TaxID=2715536 RepID=UPI00140D3F93|nr:mandelate racemase/muconate lactonizing enzyme family protein [Phytoactinopolyspora limicola]
MLIDNVETFVLKLPADEAYLGRLPDGTRMGDAYTVRPPWRSLYSARFETLLVKVSATDGTAGWGEALAPVAPEVPATIVDLLLAPVLRGMDARSPRPAWSRLRDLMRERGHLVGHQADALAAVDIALWDLAGRLAELPVAAMLGGAFRNDVPAYVSGLPRTTDAERAELASQWEGHGASAVKLHLGYGVEADIATVDAIQAAAPSLRVAVDAHWAYNGPDALRLARALGDRGGWFLEAPLAPEDVAGHTELASASPVPIAIGETLRNRYEFGAWLDARAARIVQPDVARTGITEAMIIADLAAARHLPVAPHHSVGLAVALAAGLHVSAAVEDLVAFEYQPSSVDVGTRILGRPIPVAADQISLPDGPGLGIDVDEGAVRALAAASPSIHPTPRSDEHR